MALTPPPNEDPLGTHPAFSGCGGRPLGKRGQGVQPVLQIGEFVCEKPPAVCLIHMVQTSGEI